MIHSESYVHLDPRRLLRIFSWRSRAPTAGAESYGTAICAAVNCSRLMASDRDAGHLDCRSVGWTCSVGLHQPASALRMAARLGTVYQPLFCAISALLTCRVYTNSKRQMSLNQGVSFEISKERDQGDIRWSGRSIPPYFQCETHPSSTVGSSRLADRICSGSHFISSHHAASRLCIPRKYASRHGPATFPSGK
jgi:hypothetical protein